MRLPCIVNQFGSTENQWLISCPIDYPDSCRGGFTNNICQKRTISKTRPGNCIMGDRSDMISNPLASSCIHLSVLELCVKSVLCGLIIPMQPELIWYNSTLLKKFSKNNRRKNLSTSNLQALDNKNGAPRFSTARSAIMFVDPAVADWEKLTER